MIGDHYFKIFFLLSVCVAVSLSQLHLLKYIKTGTNPPSSAPAQINSSLGLLNDTGALFTDVDRICVHGMWALYSSTRFGEGFEDSTTVISIRGFSASQCTNSGQLPALKNVRSVRYLGNANFSEDGVQLFSQPFLLGGVWNASRLANLTDEAINGFPLGSIAITGTNPWVICSDRECRKGVCVNMKNYDKLFLQRNVAGDSNVPWPKIVRRVQNVTVEDCAGFQSPALPAQSG